ncbi:sulfotransferase 6B1-like [Antennarius striatus]|uniref:sulfotransferase 6B1-like n=1 Tax=Antennarius striatus TaxID=241820 RepID=UPI0035B3C0B8
MTTSQSLRDQIAARHNKAAELSDEDKLYRYNGVLYPEMMCPESHLKVLGDTKARPDDIMLVAYPKCGFTWMLGVLKTIIAEATGNKVVTEILPLIEFLSREDFKIFDEAPSPRFVGTHMHPDNIPVSFYTKKTKMLVILRNPKDTLVSYYHFYNNNPVLPSAKSWDTFFSQFMSGNVAYGLYFDYILAWEKKMDDPNVKIITYEELKQDPSQGIRDISTFFGLTLTEDQVQQVAEGTSFDAMKKNSAKTHATMGSVFFRKGMVGDWKNHFTPEQSQEMDDAFNKHLAGTRLGAKLNYQQYCQ